MPHRIELIGNLFEVIFLTIFNTLIFITWMSFFAAIPIFISTIYGIGRIKRDIDKYHDGKILEYMKFLIGKGKKN